jgi:hypothetical protein
MYLVNTRPDICYVVNQLSQVMVKPTKLFWKVGKHVLRYLKGTSEYGLWYRHRDEVKLHGFMDAYWVDNPTERKRTSGGSLVSNLQLFLGIAGNKDPWHLVQQKQNTWQRVKLHVRLSR